MKKSLIAVGVAAALGSVAGSAVAANGIPNAVERVFNPTGVGHTLIVPYFSTQGGNVTLLNIVNTDVVRGKAVKIRFRGASNSDDIFDFQVFLSPGDVWTANVSMDANTGLSNLTTVDKSCTVPSIIKASAGNNFVTLRLNQRLTGDALASETREGYIEILTMGDIVDTGSNDLFDTTKHDAGVPECDSDVLDTLVVKDPQLTTPTTGLFANWTIINVPKTLTWTGEAEALEARDSGGAPAYGQLVFWPQLDTPAANIELYTADPLFRTIGTASGPTVTAANYDLPDLSTPYCNCPLSGTTVGPISAANDLSYAFAARSWAGEFLTDDFLTAETDWVVSSPTRRYYVAVGYTSGTGSHNLLSNYPDESTASVYYRGKAGALTANVNLSGYQICTALDSVKFYDREETGTTPQGPIISPGQAAKAPSLCGEISTLSINGLAVPNGSVTSSANTTPASLALGSKVARANVALPFADGWGWVTSANSGYGLPLFVTQFATAFNPVAAPGVSGNYAASWEGRYLTLPSSAPPVPTAPQ